MLQHINVGPIENLRSGIRIDAVETSFRAEFQIEIPLWALLKLRLSPLVISIFGKHAAHASKKL